MITKGDDYPIHQTPDPIAYAGSDRNFYDRYFFNGYSRDGELFFAAALGVYPHLNIMDAAFCVRIAGQQYNLRGSRHLNMERMDTSVGPIAIDVIEPLQSLRIRVEDNEHGIRADIRFDGRFAPVEEPRAPRRNGPRMLSDFTRLTQFGRYSGWVEADGKRIEFTQDEVEGVRDRSWGVRHVGERDPQPMVPAQDHQFHWVWLSAQFDDCAVLVYRNEDTDGVPWNAGAVIFHEDGRVDHYHDMRLDYGYRPGSRWAEWSLIELMRGRDTISIRSETGRKFYMTGLGYMDPQWSHGINKGPLAIGFDHIDTDTITTYAPPHIYTQSIASVAMTLPDGKVINGRGALETLSFGAHHPLGFKEAFDGA